MLLHFHLDFNDRLDSVLKFDSSVTQRSDQSQERHSRLFLLIIILTALTAARLVGLKFSVVDLYYDEAQYWSWAQDPALGYFTKPPLLAWVIAGITRVCGNSEWCVRSPAPVFYFATSIVVYFIGRTLYDERTGLWAGLLTAFTTGIVFSSRIISTDVPLLLFWALSLLAYVKLLDRPTIEWATVLGLSIGLGLLSKYAMVYFFAGVVLAAFMNGPARALLKNPLLWIAFFVALIVVSPNLIWNISNSFTTFKHTGSLVLDEPFNPNPLRALEFFCSQFGVIGPIVFTVMIVATLKLKSADLIAQDRLMVAFFVIPILVVTAFAFFAQAFANWASPACISGLVLAAAVLTRQHQWRWLWASIALGGVMQATLLYSDAIATRLSIFDSNPYHRTMGWSAFGARVGQLAMASGAQAIANDSRGEFAALRYYARDRSQTVLSFATSDSPRFDSFHPVTQSSPEPLLFVTTCPDPKRLQVFYGDVVALGPLKIPVVLKRERTFFAFKLSKNKGPIDALPECKAE